MKGKKYSDISFTIPCQPVVRSYLELLVYGPNGVGCGKPIELDRMGDVGKFFIEVCMHPTAANDDPLADYTDKVVLVVGYSEFRRFSLPVVPKSSVQRFNSYVWARWKEHFLTYMTAFVDSRDAQRGAARQGIKKYLVRFGFEETSVQFEALKQTYYRSLRQQTPSKAE